MEKIEIPLSKNKIVLLVIGSILLIVLCIFTFTTFADMQTKHHPQLVKALGIAGVLFFGATGLYGVRKMFDNKIGLTIDENGILDNSSASSIGLIKWADITAIETKDISSTKILFIYTTDPEPYLGRVKGLKRKMLQMNENMYGTPFSIASTTLKCNFKELEKLVNDNFRKHKTL